MTELDLEEGMVLHSATTTYTVTQFLGQGTFGKVVKCRRDEDKKFMAVKVMKRENEEMTQKEVNI